MTMNVLLIDAMSKVYTDKFDIMWNIVGILIVLLALTLLYRIGHKATVKKLILGLVVRAEKKLGSGTGELKYAEVVVELYERLPTILRWLFTEKDIDQFIEEAVAKLKDVLAKGVTLTGYDDEQIIEAIDESK